MSRSEFCSVCGPNGLDRWRQVFSGGPARLNVGVSVDQNCRACHRGSRDDWGLAGGVPAAVHRPLRGPAGRRRIARARPRLPIAAAAP